MSQILWMFLICSTGLAVFSQTLPPHAAGHSGPSFLSFDELKELATTPEPKGKLTEKLSEILATPFIGNDATLSPPRQPTVEGLGSVVRAASWNIERGLNFDLIEAALGDAEHFRHASGYENCAGGNNDAVTTQLYALQAADVLILNEVDLGMKRTDYRHVSRELAAALHMSYAFGVEFVEVDPVFDLGIEKIDLPDKVEAGRLADDLTVDPMQYRGLHGNAVLSRYPIERARIVRLPICYDWYHKETKAVAKLEQGKRWTARKLFLERINREVRRGGRIALIVDLASPELPTGKLTGVSVHLENRCPPECRQRQIRALLNVIQSIENPVLLAGDLNTSGQDATPTSVRNEIMKRVTDYTFWADQAVFWFSPVSIPHYAMAPLRYFHQHLDPTAWHLPFLWENRERGLFQSVEHFRFSDGYAFDFRGTTERTVQKKQRTLANSNERGRKGFVPTYAFERNFGSWVGNFKLDWFFVKPFIQNPRALEQSYRLAPHFPVTMNELNQSVLNRISDHPPMTVDLPLAEPPQVKTGSR